MGLPLDKLGALSPFDSAQDPEPFDSAQGPGPAERACRNGRPYLDAPGLDAGG
jgi:hypothetical protein